MPKGQPRDSAGKSSAVNDGSASIRPDAFRFAKLKAAATAEHYRLHVAALEWSLDSPITIRGEEDIVSKKRWSDGFRPYAHQVRNMQTYFRLSPVMLLADEVGLGKTISAGLVLAEAIDRKNVQRALIVAPKIILPQWKEELWVNFKIITENAVGVEVLNAIRRRVPVIVTTYQSFRSHLDAVCAAGFDMVILDEAHKLRNLHGAPQPPQFALGVRSALERKAFKRVLMLTATPIQNRLWDLYSLVDLLTVAKGHHANPLGSPASFKAKYIEDGRGLKIRQDNKTEFLQHLSRYIARTRRSEARLVFPTRKVKTHRVAASAVEIRIQRLIADFMSSHQLNGLSQTSIGQALMSSPQALRSQLENMAQRGTVPRELAREISTIVTHDAVSGKLAGLTSLIRELSTKRPIDWRVVVFTSRTETQEVIGRHLKSMGVPSGFITGSRASENERAIQAFRESPPGIRVLVSTDAGAEGVNLQVANVLVNFDLPWNPMILEQRIGRVQRLASKHAEVTVLNLVLKGSVEESVVARLVEKLQAITESLGDIEGILGSASHVGDDEEAFETMIRRLVVDSLRGIDVERSMILAQESMEEAIKLYEESRATVEQTLGDLQDLHRMGPEVPDISPVVPSIDARDFVLRALSRDGARIRPIDGDVLAISMPGQNEFRITFKEDVAEHYERGGAFGGNPPRLYLPGKRDFERLAQSWVEKSGALIVDRSRPSETDIGRLLSEWLSMFEGLSLVDLKVIRRDEGFDGELLVKSSVAVHHDRLEKLVAIRIGTGDRPDVHPPTDSEAFSPADCDTAQLGDVVRDKVAAAIQAEPDLSKFSSFYRKRLEEELQATSDPSSQKRLREQFTPVAAADAVGIRGVKYAVYQVEAQIRIDGEGPYGVDLTVLPGEPIRDAVSPITDWVRCEVSGRPIPESAAGLCSVSGKRVLKHLLGQSVVSGRLALKQHMITCAATDTILLSDESEVCAVTGQRVRKGILAVSVVSGRAAMPSEFVKCEITEAQVLPDELLTSSFSGRRYRCDQSAVSVLSGCSGHVSEFVRAVLPDGLIGRSEALQSEVSGVWAAKAKMLRSKLPPGRLGLPSEAVRSEVCGRLVLKDEVVASDVSGRLALPDQLVLCEVTHKRCLPNEVAISEVSGRRYRADQQRVSVASSRTGHAAEFVESVDPVGLIASDEADQSEVSGKWGQKGTLACSDVPPHRKAFVEELVVSVVSGKRALPDEVVRCKATGKPALPGELVECEFSGVTVLPDQLTVSQISGKRLRADKACTSVHSGRVGHKSEFVKSVLPPGLIAADEAGRSAVSRAVAAKDLLVESAVSPGRHGLPDETVSCAVTGKVVLKDEVRPSALSGIRALPSELRTCEFTGVAALPSELLSSDVSGKWCRHDEAVTSALSGRRGHVSEFVRSVAPTGWIATDEALRSDVSGEWGAKSMLAPSARPPHRLGLPHEMVECEVSGQRLLRDEVAPSAVSGKVVDSLLLVASAASERRAIAEEMVVCATTGGRLLPDETGICAITGKRVDNRSLIKSDESGAVALSWLLVRCAETSKLVLPSETVRCELSGQPVLIGVTAECAVTGRRALMRLMQRCPGTGAFYINDAASLARMKDLAGSEQLLTNCQWTDQVRLAHLLSRCSLTGLLVERSQLSAEGELSVLRKMLNGETAASIGECEPILASSLAWLRSAHRQLKGAQDGLACKSADGRRIVACVRVKSGLLGLSTYYVAVAAVVGRSPSLIAEPVMGRRSANGWIRQSP